MTLEIKNVLNFSRNLYAGTNGQSFHFSIRNLETLQLYFSTMLDRFAEIRLKNDCKLKNINLMPKSIFVQSNPKYLGLKQKKNNNKDEKKIKHKLSLVFFPLSLSMPLSCFSSL